VPGRYDLVRSLRTQLDISARSPELEPHLKPLLKLCIFVQEEADGAQP